MLDSLCAGLERLLGISKQLPNNIIFCNINCLLEAEEIFLTAKCAVNMSLKLAYANAPF